MGSPQVEESLLSSPHTGGESAVVNSGITHVRSGERLRIERPAYTVRLEFFEGPLDLLLHLIHQREVSVEEVEMAEVAEQFLEIISRASYLDLERVTEYLVIAATLLSIKSRSVLPENDIPAEDDLLGVEPGTEFYEHLRARLRAYELTKRRACELNSRPQLGIDTFSRRVRGDIPVDDSLPLDVGDTNLLATAFGRLLRRIGAGSRSLRVRLEPISLVSFMMRVVDSLHDRTECSRLRSFYALLRRLAREQGGGGRERRAAGDEEGRARRLGFRDRIGEGSRGVVIGGFIAILELVRRGIVAVAPRGDGQDFGIELRMESQAAEDVVEHLSDTEIEEESGIRIAHREERGEKSKLIDLKEFRSAPTAADSGTTDELDRGMLQEVNRG